MKFALLGAGSIGGILAAAFAKGEIPGTLEAVYDISYEKAESICKIVGGKTRAAKTIEGLLSSDADLVIEAASQEAVRSHAEDILESGKHMMIMSTGALLDDGLRRTLQETAVKQGVELFLPSGAIGGLDALKSASAAKVGQVRLRTIKNPQSLKGIPYLLEKGIDVEDIEERTVLYEGPAEEAAALFPANVNVAATLSLAGVGKEATKVTIIADPEVDRNIHEVSVKGEFGEFEMRIENLPSPQNPKTSYLAALSAIATLKGISTSLKIGT